MTPTSVGLVLVDGDEGDGATMRRDAVEIENSDEAAAAILGSEALAATRGLRLKSIGVTWSEDVGAEASKLMQTLAESGFDNIVPVAMPAATEALARGIADALGYRTTAVCAIEPDTVIALIVCNTAGVGDKAAVHTAFNHAIYSDDSLVSWLSTLFARADRQPEALVVVGSAGDFGEVCELLHDVLSVPVYAPAEAELALAKGAALATTTAAGSEFVPPEPYRGPGRHRRVDPQPARRLGRLSRPATLPLAMLVAGSVSFVASVSMAVSLQLNSDRHIPQVSTAASESAPGALVAPPAHVQVDLAREVIEPPAVEPPVVESPIVDQVPAEQPEPGEQPTPADVPQPAQPGA